MRMFYQRALVAIVFAFWTSLGLAMTVDEVSGLLKAGVSEEVILFKIQQMAGGMDLNAEEMVKLREAGASDHFILEILKTGNEPDDAGMITITPNQAAKIQSAPNSATLVIMTKPAGAKVLIDGVPQGSTPFLGNQLTLGTHDIYLSKRFFRGVNRSIEAKDGEKIEIRETLPLELPGVSLNLKTQGLPKGSRWTTLGRTKCGSSDFVYVAKEEGKEDGRIVLRTQGALETAMANTCIEILFWTQGPAPAPTAPKPDVIFQLEDVPLSALSMTEIDLVVEREPATATGLRCSIAKGPGRIVHESGSTD